MEDTITAISTAYGEGGIGIIRISGSDTRRILKKIFVPANQTDQRNQEPENRKMTYGHIVDPESGKVVDEVLSVFMKAPHTRCV